MVGENLIFSSPPTAADNKNNLDVEIKAHNNDYRRTSNFETTAGIVITKTTPPRHSLVANSSPLNVKNTSS